MGPKVDGKPQLAKLEASKDAPPAPPPATAPRLAELSAPPITKTVWSTPATLPPTKLPAKTTVDALPGFPLVPEEDRAALKAAWAKASPTERVAIADILTSPELAKLDATERHQLIAVIAMIAGVSYDDESRSQGTGDSVTPMVALHQALTTTLDGRPRLLAPATDGKTALHHLHRLCTAAPNPEVLKRTGNSQAEIVCGLVQEIGDPRRVDQTGAGTCTVTSIQSVIALRIPGEYARVCADLVLTTQTTLANGQVMHIDADGIAHALASSRTATERLFQSALIQWAGRERQGNYVDQGFGQEGFERDGAKLWDLPLPLIILSFLLFPLAIILGILRTNALHTGLNNDETKKAVEAATGERYAITQVDDGDLLAKLRRLRDDLRFDKDNTLIQIAPFSPKDPDGSHILVLVGVDETKSPPELLCRNPWGSTNQLIDGEQAPNCPPGTTYDDANAGVIRVPLTAANRKCVKAVIAPARLTDSVGR